MKVETVQVAKFNEEELKAIKMFINIVESPFFEDVPYETCMENLTNMVFNNRNYLSDEDF